MLVIGSVLNDSSGSLLTWQISTENVMVGSVLNVRLGQVLRFESSVNTENGWFGTEWQILCGLSHQSVLNDGHCP